MSNAKLFGFSIEDADGKLVITVDGAFGGKLSEFVRDEMAAGREWRVLSCLMSLDGIARLGKLARSQGAGAQRAAAEVDGVAADLETIFKQGFADPAEEFGARLETYRRTLAELQGELRPSARVVQAATV